MAELNFDKVLASLKIRIDEIVDETEFDEVLKEYTGKDSLLSAERKKLSILSKEDKKVYGEKLNNVNKSIISNINKAKEKFINNKYTLLENEENEDITIDWITRTGTHRQVLSQVMDEVVDIFASIGYKVAYGPEVETSWHNFDALNTPEWHPARYESDTLYTDNNLETLLRTQTSTVQIRYMEENDPPVYIVAPGRVFRSDQLDATHSPVFHQLEGLAIDKNLKFTDLKGTLEYFV